MLSKHFTKYLFKETYDNFDWILNLFIDADIDLSGRKEEELAELSYDQTLMISFTQKPFVSFWLSVADEYPLLSQKATKILSAFATTYMCETAFLALANMKTKYRSRIAVEADLRV